MTHLTTPPRSPRRGKRKVTIAGVTEEFYAAYTLIAARENRSLNAQLVRALTEWLNTHAPHILTALYDGLDPEEIEYPLSTPPQAATAQREPRTVLPYVPPPGTTWNEMMAQQAEIARHKPPRRFEERRKWEAAKAAEPDLTVEEWHRRQGWEE